MMSTVDTMHAVQQPPLPQSLHEQTCGLACRVQSLSVVPCHSAGGRLSHCALGALASKEGKHVCEAERMNAVAPVSYTHLRAHETEADL
eukprot:4492974-Amphidinium_carterae.1